MHRITVYRWEVATIAGKRTNFQGETEGYRGSIWSTPGGAAQDVQGHLTRTFPSLRFFNWETTLADGQPPFFHTSPICMQAAVEQADYDNRWELHCETCNGTGTTGSGVMDWGTGNLDIDPCEDCIGKGLCPRCRFTNKQWLHGIEVGLEPEGACVKCAWTGKNPGDHGVIYECECGMEQEIA